MGKDYYKTLGIEKNASDEEIKKAFRTLAHKYHPDKATGDEQKFKEINEAYQVLKDPQKRKQYDQFGSGFQGGAGGGFNWADFAQGGGNGGFQVDMNDLGDIFGSFFGGGRQQQRRSGPQRGQDIQVNIRISFDQAIRGFTKEIELDKTETCSHCQGNGAEPGTKINTCEDCKGTGAQTQIQQTMLGAFQTRVTCRTCMGQGSTFEKPCTTCDGKGIERKKKTLKIEVPAGINTGETLRLTGEGEAGQKGGHSGDLYVHVLVEPSEIFQRQGYDIFTVQEVDFPTAVLGGKVLVETIDGPVELKVPATTKQGSILKLKGKGVTKVRSKNRGDHLVEIRIHVPKHVSKQAKKQLEQLKDLL